MGVPIVAEPGGVAGGVTGGVGREPAFGGVDCAVLFDLPVLRRDELRAQRHDLRVAGADEDRGDRAVKMGDPAVGVAETGTVGAVDVFGGGGEIPGGIQREEPGAAAGAHGLEQTALVEGAMRFLEETEEMLRLDRVQHLADVIVRRDALDLEERAGVVAAAGRLHVLLEAQERGALREENRESRQGDVGHGVAGVVAGAPVGEPGGDDVPAFEELVEAARIHAVRNAGTAVKVQVTIV